MEEQLKQIATGIESVTKSIEGFDARITALEGKVNSAYSAPAKEDDRSDAEIRKDGTFSLGAYFRGLGLAAKGVPFEVGCIRFTEKGSKDWKDAGFTAEVCTKQMSTTVGSGGYFAPENWIQSQFVDILRPKIVTIAAGIDRSFTNLSNADNKIARLATGCTAYWVAENAAITESTPTDEQINLTPHKAACMTKCSNEILKLSNPSIQSIISMDMAQKLAAIVDLAVLEGSGGAGQPTGIKTAVSTNTVTTGGATTWAHLEEFLYDVSNANYPGLKPVWFMPPRTYSSIRQLTTTYIPLFVGTPQAEALTQDLAGRALIGYPVYTSSQMTTTGGTGSDAVVLFGDASEVGLADWGPPSFAASAETSTSFEYDQTWFRCLWMVDVFLRHETSWCKCTDTTS